MQHAHISNPVASIPVAPSSPPACHRSQPSMQRSDDRGNLQRTQPRRFVAGQPPTPTPTAPGTRSGGKPGDRIKTRAAPRTRSGSTAPLASFPHLPLLASLRLLPRRTTPPSPTPAPGLARDGKPPAPLRFSLCSGSPDRRRVAGLPVNFGVLFSRQ